VGCTSPRRWSLAHPASAAMHAAASHAVALRRRDGRREHEWVVAFVIWTTVTDTDGRPLRPRHTRDDLPSATRKARRRLSSSSCARPERSPFRCDAPEPGVLTVADRELSRVRPQIQARSRAAQGNCRAMFAPSPKGLLNGVQVSLKCGSLRGIRLHAAPHCTFNRAIEKGGSWKHELFGIVSVCAVLEDGEFPVVE